MDLRISGKNALVCGASKGLGRACAEALAKEGVNVTLVARNPVTLEARRTDYGQPSMLQPNPRARILIH